MRRLTSGKAQLLAWHLRNFDGPLDANAYGDLDAYYHCFVDDKWKRKARKWCNLSLSTCILHVLVVNYLCFELACSVV